MHRKIIKVLLLANDSPDCCFVKKALCEYEGSIQFSVEVVENADCAASLLAEQKYDVVLLDVDSHRNGIDCLANIHSKHPYIPIIIMTGQADDETVVRAIKKGADDYLVKGKMYKDVMMRSIRYAVERKKENIRAEKKLERERNKAQNYLDVAGVILVVIDDEQKVRLINKRGCEILGYTEEKIIGKSWPGNFVPQRVRDKSRTRLEGLLKGQAEHFEFFENFLLTSAGSERYIAWHNTVLRKNSGDVEAVLRSGEDITERKKAEFELKLLNRELETTIEKLMFSNKELQNFVHVAAHDLKAPLRAIGTLSDWIVADYADKLDEVGRERVRLLIERTRRMSKLIDGVLLYSGIARAREKERKIDLNILLKKIVEDMNLPDGFTIRIEKPLPLVFCDKAHLEQIFNNLLDNAIKFIDKPRGRICVKCEETDNFWEFIVADNGCGIEQKHYERIFRIFETLQQYDGVNGNGVGLAIVKKIVEMYGGNVWVESKLEKGSTFHFTLPKIPDVIRNETTKLAPAFERV